MGDDWKVVWSCGETKLSTKNLNLNDELKEKLWETVLEKNPPIKIFGKIARMRRAVGFYSNESNGYAYSGQKSKTKPLTPEMEELLKMVNSITGNNYNGLLFNLYANGEEYIGAHRDDEEGEIREKGVVALSLGAGRKFRIRKYKKGGSGEIVKDHITGDCELMWMQGERFHVDYTHEIPVEKRVKEPRLSITFRKHEK